jgi:hypothetical protein
MPKHRDQKHLVPLSLTRTEKKAAEIDTSVRKELEQTRAADLKKIARLKALRLAEETRDDSSEPATASRAKPR